ncbi:MAG: ABC transporter substrate-binding protein [Candidatus Komeilibacteria bacterium]
MSNKKLANLAKTLVNKTRATVSQWNKNQSEEVVFADLDRKSISNLHNNRWPTWQQLKHLIKILNPWERNLFRGAVIVIVIAIVGLLGQFYWQHSKIVPRAGGDYIEGLIGAPNFINPILAQYNDVDRDLSKLLFNGLLKYDQQGSLQLELAESLQVSPDQKEYNFTLKKNIFWHDGQPLTADDIIFTIASIQDPQWQSPLRLSLANVQVEKIDDHTIKFLLQEPSANFLSSLTVGILPEHLWLSVPSANITLVELNKKPIGTGPFLFSSLTKDKNGNIRTIVLVRNNNYFDSLPYLNQITFKFYGDYNTGTQALKNNNVEGLSLLPKEYRSELDKNTDLIFHQLSLPQYTAIFFNTTKNNLLKDKALRQGLAHAINKQKILSDSLNSEGQIINGPILPGYTGYTDKLTTYNYDPDQASALLDKTGWLKTTNTQYRQKNDTELTFTITTVENPEYEKAANIIKDGWEAIGVKTNIKIVSKDKIRSDVIEPRDYEALLFGQLIKSDPYPFWHSSQNISPGVNLSIWGHRGVDDLLEQARSTANEQIRTEKLIEFQTILTDNAPAIFLYNPVYLYPVSDKIKGIDTANIISPADRFNNITKWYIKTKRQFSW